MKMILLEAQYPERVAIPAELAGFLPSMILIETIGYGDERILRRKLKPISAEFIDFEEIKPVNPPIVECFTSANVPDENKEVAKWLATGNKSEVPLEDIAF